MSVAIHFLNFLLLDREPAVSGGIHSLVEIKGFFDDLTTGELGIIRGSVFEMVSVD